MRILISLATLFAGLVVSQAASADQFVTCQSIDYRQATCYHGMGRRATVSVYRQLSDRRGPCIQNQTYWWDQDYIYVDRGCRAEFRIERNGGGGDRRQSVQCDSINYQPNNCYVRGTIQEARLQRQLSTPTNRGGTCYYGRDWYYDRGSITVMNGCRAVFDVWLY